MEFDTLIDLALSQSIRFLYTRYTVGDHNYVPKVFASCHYRTDSLQSMLLDSIIWRDTYEESRGEQK